MCDSRTNGENDTWDVKAVSLGMDESIQFCEVGMAQLRGMCCDGEVGGHRFPLIVLWLKTRLVVSGAIDDDRDIHVHSAHQFPLSTLSPCVWPKNPGITSGYPRNTFLSAMPGVLSSDNVGSPSARHDIFSACRRSAISSTNRLPNMSCRPFQKQHPTSPK